MMLESADLTDVLLYIVVLCILSDYVLRRFGFFLGKISNLLRTYVPSI